jgi:hypothetical protein
MRHKLLIIAALFFASGCPPKLGDECETGFECSANNNRFCDRSQPGGYCTIANCEPDSCGSEGYCVRFKPDEPRLSIDWCMAKCQDTGDCDRKSYVCRSANDLNRTADGGVSGGVSDGRLRRAEVLDDKKDAKFCVVRE